MIDAILLVVGAYFWGAIPSAYIVARSLGHIDIRQYGSGNPGAANVVAHVGTLTGLSLGTFDCLGKGTLPVVVANLLGQDLTVQAAAGLAGIAGHNWSPYMRFTGGRGVATAVGVVLGFQMWPESVIIGLMMGAFGYLIFRESGLWTFIAILALPLLAYLFDRESVAIVMTLVLGTLLIVKRLTANWEMPSGQYPFFHTIAYRLLWDRDVPRQLDWTTRGPLPEAERQVCDTTVEAMRQASKHEDQR